MRLKFLGGLEKTEKRENLVLGFEIFLNQNLSSSKFVLRKIFCSFADLERSKLSYRYPFFLCSVGTSVIFILQGYEQVRRFMILSSLIQEINCRVVQRSRTTIISLWTVII